MKFIAGLMLLVLLTATGCGGTGEESSDNGAEEDLTKRWGPAEQPDRYEQPLEFLYWRVDMMFDNTDLDGDGQLSTDEYRGEGYNFERIDANGNDWLTKKEVIDDAVATMREEGSIP